jgi:tetratricopeptide (TPR) repeat protein
MQRSLRLHPDSRQLRYWLGELYVTWGKYEKAISAFEDATRSGVSLDSAADRAQRGRIYERIGDSESAAASQGSCRDFRDDDPLQARRLSGPSPAVPRVRIPGKPFRRSASTRDLSSEVRCGASTGVALIRAQRNFGSQRQTFTLADLRRAPLRSSERSSSFRLQSRLPASERYEDS